MDAVTQGSWGSWAIEVKTGSVSSHDLKGLSEFTRRHSAFRSLVLCDDKALDMVARAGLPAMPWCQFLLNGPSAAT